MIGTDGANDRTLLKVNPQTSIDDACWSPTGSHVAYTLYDFSAGDAIYRVASTGGGSPVNLTPEFQSAWMWSWTQ